MAPTSPRLATLLLATALLAGCSQDAEPRTGVADSTVTPSPADPGTPSTESAPSTEPAPSPEAASTSGAPGVPNPPDLSSNVVDCDAVDEPCDYGDDAELDRLWDACAAGEGRACDRLYYDSGFDSRYEQFGNTCGDRDMTIPCPEDLS